MATTPRTRGRRVGTGDRDAFQCWIYPLVWLAVSSIAVGVQAQSKPGFVSIDCGATSPYSDASTTLPWEGDSQYTSTGLNGKLLLAVNSRWENSDALSTFRYFRDNRSKHCYDLPTPGGEVSFLLRAMFLHGGATELVLPIEFDVAVNGTTWFTVYYASYATYNILTTPVEYEGIFFSPGNVTHVCLVTRTGVPFISSLELRQLDRDLKMYKMNATLGNGVYLSNLYRINSGVQQGSATVRYPDDLYDRFWAAPGEWASGLASLAATGVTNSTTLSKRNNVPPTVMKSAWLSNQPNTSFSFSLPGTSPSGLVYIAVYLEEVKKGAAIGDRSFILNMNGDLTNITAKTDGQLLFYWDWGVPANPMVSFTLTAGPNSPLGPIVNAVEVYAHLSFDNSATAAKDVDTLAALQVSFNLTDWQGDPCYPVSWDWVGCTSGTQARVEKLLLSSMRIYASIPAAISNLDALTVIHLDNNRLFGAIPDSLAHLPNILDIYVNNNNLSGPVPDALVTKLGSNFDYAGNILLGGLPPSSSPNSTTTTTTTKKKSNTAGIVAGIIGGLAGLAVLVILIWYLWSKKSKKLQRQLAATQQVKPSITEAGGVSYEAVKAATNNFSKKLGQGAFGDVYHGWLDNREVAVKLNNSQSTHGRTEFITEVDILTRVHHRNLVSLVGYCSEGQYLILIYEFEVNGTLREWLGGKQPKPLLFLVKPPPSLQKGEDKISRHFSFSPPPLRYLRKKKLKKELRRYTYLKAQENGKSRGTLDWKLRLQIAADGAKGLEYLHKGCNPTIIHRDVKSSNILLGSSMTAKVADFGISKSTTGENTTGYSTVVKGTPGYLDPEYHLLGRLTHKSDVYSYGVVLAEILTGLPPFCLHTEGSPMILMQRVRKLMQTNDIDALADPKLKGAFNPESMWRMADIALSCVEPEGCKRPDFPTVVKGINEAIELEKNFTSPSPTAPRSNSFSLTSSGNLGYV